MVDFWQAKTQVVDTLVARHHCNRGFLFFKIQPNCKPWQPWQPCGVGRVVQKWTIKCCRKEGLGLSLPFVQLCHEMICHTETMDSQ